MKRFLIILILITTVIYAAEPSSEQLQLMREYGLSVPPVILDKNGHDRSTVSKKTTDRLPDLANDALSPVEKSKEIIAEFGPAIPFELPLKHPVAAEILADVVGVEYVDDTTAKEKIETKPGLVFVDFYATWCVPCIRMAAIVESMAAQFKQVSFKKVDTDIATALCRHINVPNVPHFAIFDSGKIIASRTGACTREVMEEWVRSNINIGFGEVVLIPSTARIIYESVPAAYREYQANPGRAWRSCGRGIGRH